MRGGWVTVRISQRLDRTVVAVVLSIPALLAAGALYDSRFLSPDYLLLQLQVAFYLQSIHRVQRKPMGEMHVVPTAHFYLKMYAGI